MTKIDAHDTRLENLRKLIAAMGGPTVVSHKLGHANGSYLAQMAGPNPSRPVGEKVARSIEATLKIPAGWLDLPEAKMTFADSHQADLVFTAPDGHQVLVEAKKYHKKPRITLESPAELEREIFRASNVKRTVDPEETESAQRRDIINEGKRVIDLGEQAFDYFDEAEKELGRVLQSTLDIAKQPAQTAGGGHLTSDFRFAGEYTPGPRDLPVFGSFKGGFDGNTIDYHDPVEFIERPRELIGVKKACGIYIVNDSTEPRYFQGEMALVHPGLPVKAGDHVAVELTNGNGMVKRLVKKADDYVLLAQYNAPEEKRFKRAEIAGIYKIIGTRS